MMKNAYEEVELAYDLQEYIIHSKDVKISPDLKESIAKITPETLLSVTKKILPSMEIISVKEVDEEFIKSVFPSVKF